MSTIAEGMAAAVRPFRIDIAQLDLEDLAERLERTGSFPRSPDRPTSALE